MKLVAAGEGKSLKINGDVGCLDIDGFAGSGINQVFGQNIIPGFFDRMRYGRDRRPSRRADAWGQNERLRLQSMGPPNR